MTKTVDNISAAKEAERLHSDSTAKHHIIRKNKHTSLFILILAKLDLIKFMNVNRASKKMKHHLLPYVFFLFLIQFFMMKLRFMIASISWKASFKPYLISSSFNLWYSSRWNSSR